MTWGPLLSGDLSNPQGRRDKAIDVEHRGLIYADLGFVLPVKTTTGDPTGIPTGYTYMNTFDKAIRSYNGSAWVDLGTWT